jgi:hypothetical protein
MLRFGLQAEMPRWITYQGTYVPTMHELLAMLNDSQTELTVNQHQRWVNHSTHSQSYQDSEWE